MKTTREIVALLNGLLKIDGVDRAGRETLVQASRLIAAMGECEAASRGEILVMRMFIDGLKKNPTCPKDPLVSVAFNVMDGVADVTDQARAALDALTSEFKDAKEANDGK